MRSGLQICNISKDYILNVKLTVKSTLLNQRFRQLSSYTCWCYWTDFNKHHNHCI